MRKQMSVNSKTEKNESDENERNAMTGPAVVTEELVKAFGDVRAVDGISFEIEEGEFFSLLGPSGCGKTTTLRMLAGFERPTDGTITIEGERVDTVPPYDRDVGMVFQSYALFPHKTVGENVGFGLKMEGVPREEREGRIADILDLVGLPGFEDRSPDELSGGQQQRIALARALVIEPSVLLLDEPLSNLDLKLRKEMQFELKRIQTELGITTVYVTHDQEEALSMSDKILVMNEGKSEQVGTPREVYHEPANEFVAEFIGDSNVLQATIDSKRNDSIDLDLLAADQNTITLPKDAVSSADVLDDDRITLSVRAENLEITEATERNGGVPTIGGTIKTKTFRGKTTSFLVDIGDEEIVVESSDRRSQEQFTIGDDVSVTWDENECLLLSG